MAEKLYYSMGEVAELFDVKTSLLRHWESEFSILRPKRNKKGNRLFSAEDVENLKLIYHLVKEQGMTLEGAKKAMKGKRGSSEVPRDAELLERLQKIRSLLVEVREDLKVVEGDIRPGDEYAQEAAGETPATEAPVRKRKAVVKIEPAEETETADKPKPGAPRKPRRKKEEAEHKELFAFYEQSLF